MLNDLRQVHERVMRNLGAKPLKIAVRVTPDAILTLEDRVGYHLPVGYSEFLQQYGFFSLTNNYVVCGPPEDQCDIATFYGLGSGSGQDIDPDYMLGWEGVPDTMLQVASSDSGEVALSLAGADAGHVYLCAAPHLEMDGPIHLADSFEAFLLLLRIDDESAD